jgi:hypothetical protein
MLLRLIRQVGVAQADARWTGKLAGLASAHLSWSFAGALPEMAVAAEGMHSPTKMQASLAARSPRVAACASCAQHSSATAAAMKESRLAIVVPLARRASAGRRPADGTPASCRRVEGLA